MIKKTQLCSFQGWIQCFSKLRKMETITYSNNIPQLKIMQIKDTTHIKAQLIKKEMIQF